jgi:hypothetical protein
MYKPVGCGVALAAGVGMAVATFLAWHSAACDDAAQVVQYGSQHRIRLERLLQRVPLRLRRSGGATTVRGTRGSRRVGMGMRGVNVNVPGAAATHLAVFKVCDVCQCVDVAPLGFPQVALLQGDELVRHSLRAAAPTERG